MHLGRHLRKVMCNRGTEGLPRGTVLEVGEERKLLGQEESDVQGIEI